MESSEPTQACAQRDLVASRSALWLWGLPVLLVLVGVFWGAARAPLWSAGFFSAGVACLVNAARCSRTHCYFTGPLYLVLSLASALIGVGAVSWSWWWVAAAFVLGTFLAHVPEHLGKRYLKAPSSP